MAIMALAIAIALPGAYQAQAETPSSARAEAILRKIDDMWRGISSHAKLAMSVKTANYTRSIKLEAWSLGKEKTLVRIISPLKEKGTATLKSGDTIYTYLPKTDRTIRLTAGMMMGSWMGSHFTNDDLVKESRLTDDYFVEITFDGERDGKKMMDFDLTPKPEAAVVWGKIQMEVWVSGEDYIPVHEVYFDEDLKPARVMTFHNVRLFGGRRIPAVLKAVPSNLPGEFTELTYEAMEFDIPLADSLFSLSELRRAAGAP
ncbi:MAG: outer membrane lipoprotein-sorting protein [Nitrospinae bacterium]|nr:outer membrane lipoprotein-sorting protein [Nitrospinota bacterium]